jgi:hypothetical protein
MCPGPNQTQPPVFAVFPVACVSRTHFILQNQTDIEEKGEHQADVVVWSFSLKTVVYAIQ